MKIKWKTWAEWGLIVLLFLPVYLMAHLRMHHRNLSLFVLLSLLCVIGVILCYYIKERRAAKIQGSCENKDIG